MRCPHKSQAALCATPVAKPVDCGYPVLGIPPMSPLYRQAEDKQLRSLRVRSPDPVVLCQQRANLRLRKLKPCPCSLHIRASACCQTAVDAHMQLHACRCETTACVHVCCGHVGPALRTEWDVLCVQLPSAQPALRHRVLLLLQHHHRPGLRGAGRLVRPSWFPTRHAYLTGHVDTCFSVDLEQWKLGWVVQDCRDGLGH